MTSVILFSIQRVFQIMIYYFHRKIFKYIFQIVYYFGFWIQIKLKWQSLEIKRFIIHHLIGFNFVLLNYWKSLLIKIVCIYSDFSLFDCNNDCNEIEIDWFVIIGSNYYFVEKIKKKKKRSVIFIFMFVSFYSSKCFFFDL